MVKLAAVLTLCIWSIAAFAHEDRLLPIRADGTLDMLPAEYGPMKVSIGRSSGDKGSITSVGLSSPRFHIRLRPCILERLKDVSHIEASGSWYHDLKDLPPYVSLIFFIGNYDPDQFSDHYSVTFSLRDGQIIGAQHATKPWQGSSRFQEIAHADKCSSWRQVGLWPNNSFKPTPLRGAA